MCKKNFSNSKIFASAKNCRRNSKIIELVSTIVWNMSAVKIANVNLGYDGGKMADHVGKSIFVLKLVSGSFRIQKYNLRPTSFPVAYFKASEKWASFFPSNVVAATYWFQCK